MIFPCCGFIFNVYSADLFLISHLNLAFNLPDLLLD